MLKHLILTLGLLLCLSAPAQNYVQITATNIADGAGGKLQSGQIHFTPTNGQEAKLGFHVGGGGLATVRTIDCFVVNGAITTRTDGTTCQLANVNLSNPRNVCFQTLVTDNDDGGATIQGPGLGCIQPSSDLTPPLNGQPAGAGYGWCTTADSTTTCDLDNYVPIAPSLTAVTAGPPGASATVAVGAVTTAAPGTPAAVTNTGSASNAVLAFTIPIGATGATGPMGTSTVSTSAGGAPVVISGTEIHCLTESNGADYGDGHSHTPCHDLTSTPEFQNFYGRVTSYDYGFAGASVDDLMTQYTTASTFGGIGRPNGSVQNICKAADAAHPQYIYIEWSWNQGSNSTPYSINQIKAKLQALISTINTDNPNCHPIVTTTAQAPAIATPLPANAPDFTGTGVGNWGDYQTVNAWLFTLQTTASFQLADYAHLFPLNCKVVSAQCVPGTVKGLDVYGTDCCHRHVAAQRRAAAALAQLISTGDSTTTPTDRWSVEYADRTVDCADGSFCYADLGVGDHVNMGNTVNQGVQMNNAMVPGAVVTIYDTDTSGAVLAPYLTVTSAMDGKVMFQGQPACSYSLGNCGGLPMSTAGTREKWRYHVTDAQLAAGQVGQFELDSYEPAPGFRKIPDGADGVTMRSRVTDERVDINGQELDIVPGYINTAVNAQLVLTNTSATPAKVLVGGVTVNGDSSTRYLTTTLAQNQTMTLTQTGSTVGFYADIPGFTGTCAAGTTLTVSLGKITGCQ